MPSRYCPVSNRRRPEKWRVFYAQVREDVYEYWLDLRKLLKMSVSLILAYAVKKYLCNFIKRICTDNNRFRNYIIIKEIFNDVIIWKFIRGVPHNLKKLLNSTPDIDVPVSRREFFDCHFTYS
jgi:transcription antitermination factor NusG